MCILFVFVQCDYFNNDTNNLLMSEEMEHSSYEMNNETFFGKLVDNNNNSHEFTSEEYKEMEEEEDSMEFRNFCESQERVRNNPTNSSFVEEHCSSEEKPDEFKEDDLIQIFTLFVIFLVGVFVRIGLRRTGLSIPYTVVLMVLGFIVGQLADHLCPHLRHYTAIARTKPEIILLTFLPILIFESAFSISVHTFMRSAVQILIVALPGMLISTFLTAFVCYYLLAGYKWSFVDSSLFGSIISATDPVAVVAILRELGASESLSVLIEGESLLNDGVAVLLYEIFKEMLEDAGEEVQSISTMILNIGLKFVQIAIGGPIFGYVMGKIAIAWLSKVFNDSTVEISITVAFAYLTYFIGEEVLGVSGIMAVVILGITLSSERTCISPESEKPLHHYWEMMGYLANTVLFFLIGMIIGERALTSVDWLDAIYLFVLYFFLNLIRMIMLFSLSPLLSRIGYGLEWKSILISTWGALRGGVGLCLALEVYENPHFCGRHELGPKILFQTAGTVLLTLVVNATTTKKLMQVLKMTQLSDGRRAEMENALKILHNTQSRALAASKSDRFLVNSDWNLVLSLTQVNNPYGKEIKHVEEKRKTSIRTTVVTQAISEASHGTSRRRHEHGETSSYRKLRRPLTLEEYQEFAEEARLRVLKALKISFWRQYQQGILKGVSVQILIEICNKVEDLPYKMIGSQDISKYWISNGHFPHFISHNNNNNMSNTPLNTRSHFVGNFLPPISISQNSEENSWNWKLTFWWLAVQSWFTHLMDLFVLLSLVLNIIEILYEVQILPDCLFVKPIFICLNVFQAFVFFCEFLIKVIGFGMEDFLDYHWHYVEILVMVLSFGDFLVSLMFSCDFENQNVIIYRSIGLLKVIRLFKVIGIFRISAMCNRKTVKPVLNELRNRREIEKVYLGYEIGKGFVTGVEQVFKLLPRMSDESRSLERLKRSLEREKMDVIRELGRLQRNFPHVAVAAKTRHASRAVLNHMKFTLNELANDGLLEDAEKDLLLKELEKSMKKLSKSPAGISPAPPEVILKNLEWFKDNEKLMQFVLKKAVLLTFVPGDVLYSVGDPPKGIYLIVNGLVKIQFTSSEQILSEKRTFGVMPNCELLSDLKFTETTKDLFSLGTVIGEVGFLKHQERAASATCETFLTAYYFSLEVLEEISIFSSQINPNDLFESRVWKSWGYKVATALLQRHEHYDNWSVERLEGHLERSAVPVIKPLTGIDIPEFVSDIVVIEGYFQNYDSMELYIAPCLIPRHCTRLFSKKNPITMNRLLMICHEDIELDTPQCLFLQNPQPLFTFTDIFGKVDEFTRAVTFPTKFFVGERLDIRQRRISLAITSARKKLDQMKKEQVV